MNEEDIVNTIERYEWRKKNEDGTFTTIYVINDTNAVRITGSNEFLHEVFITMREKLEGIADNATNYSHPKTHGAAMIRTDSDNRFVNDTEKEKWNGYESQIQELFQSVSEGKNAIASALTDIGIPTDGSDTFESMAEKIRNLL